jgi:hypothetical protein
MVAAAPRPPVAIIPRFATNLLGFVTKQRKIPRILSRSLSATKTLDWQLAVFNVGRLRKPLHHTDMAEFRLALDPINAIAQRTSGFVWMYDSDTTEDSSESSSLDMPQLSLWNNYGSLKHFVIQSGHMSYLRRRREWFVEWDATAWGPNAICWYRPMDSNYPTLQEAHDS